MTDQRQVSSRSGLFRYFRDDGTGTHAEEVSSQLRAWDPTTLSWVKVIVDHASGSLSVIGGGGGGGAVTVADGADVAQGTTADAAWVSGSGTVISLLKKIASAGGSAVSVADGADVAQGTTTDASSANTVVGILKAIKAAITGTLTVGTHAVTQSGGPWTVDTELPAAGALADAVANPTTPLVGAATMVWDSTLNAGAGGWLRAPGTVAAGLKVQSGQLPAALVGGRLDVNIGSPATLPVSLATNTPDVTDRAARLLGHVTVDSAPTTPVTGTFFQATQPVSLAAAVDVSDRMARLVGAVNLSQIAGTALAAKALPTNADGQVAIPVYVNAQQYATYDVAARNIATGALTANTAKAVLSLEHALASTKTVRLRRIMIHALQTTALAGLFDVEITRGTAASTAGTAVTPQPRRITDPAAEVVVKSLPTITAATVADNIPAGGFGATTALYSPPVLVYDWQEAGETKPYMLVAGALQSIVINVISTVAHNLTLTISVDLTEE